MDGVQRVTMMKTMPGSENGIHVREYVKGETYEMGAALAQSFIGSKCATPAPDKPKNENTGKGSNEKKTGKGPDENK